MELKACPFCGCEAFPGSDTIGYSIQCGGCGARSVHMMYCEGAAERWNRRYEPEDPAADPRLVREFKLEAELAASQERVRELEEKLKLSGAVSDCLGRQVQIKDDDRIFFRDKLAAVEQERDALAKAFGAVSETAKRVSGRDAT